MAPSTATNAGVVRESSIEEDLGEDDVEEETQVAPELHPPGPGITWPKIWSRGLRGRVRIIGQKVNLPGLQAAVVNYFQRLGAVMTLVTSASTVFQPSVSTSLRPRVMAVDNPVRRIYTGVTVRYQSWRGDQSAPPSAGVELASPSSLTPATVASKADDQGADKSWSRGAIEARLCLN